MHLEYQSCTLCPRACGVDRRKVRGACGMGDEVRLARAALHFGEEPCLVGEGGSGAVFFVGCPLGCVYCQNHAILPPDAGLPISEREMRDIFLRLQSEGAENLNLVSASHFLPSVVSALQSAKTEGLRIPVVYNTSGYESVASLQRLRGLVDIYLPDCKYYRKESAKRYSHAEDYPALVLPAIEEMLCQTGEPRYDERGVLLSGTCIRLLLLPDGLLEAKASLRRLFSHFGNRVIYSLLAQYTPPKASPYSELLSRVPRSDYLSLVRYAVSLGIEHAYTQSADAVGEEYTPAFDGTGVR